MTLETIHKYLKFISDECDRHLRDGEVNYDEINQLSIELERFIKKVNESDLSNEIKFQINELSFETDNKKTRKSCIRSFLSSLLQINESSTEISYYTTQSWRKEDLKKLRGDASNISLKLKMK